MSLLTDLATILAAKPAQERGAIGEWTHDLTGGHSTSAGIAVSSESAMRLSAVYGARRIISYAVASLPASVLTKTEIANGRSRREPLRPAPLWLESPNADQVWPEVIAQCVDSLLGDGNLFLDISNKDRRGNPFVFHVLNPNEIVVGRIRETGELIYATTRGEPIDRRDILHVRALTLPGRDRGLSPIEMARQEIGIGQATQKFAAKFYVNGATVSAVLEFADGMSEEEIRANAQIFRDTYSGADRSHSIAALAGATYKPMAITQQQAQFLESREFTVVDIGTRIYGVPPHRLGAALETPQFGSSVEQWNMAFVQDAVIPWTTLIQAAFTRYMLPRPAYLHLSLNGLLRGDATSRAAFYQTMRQLGVVNADDILDREDENPLPDGKGQAYWMPANTYLVGPDGFPLLPERQAAPRSVDPLAPIRSEKIALIRERRAQDLERGRNGESTRAFAAKILAPLVESYSIAGLEVDAELLLQEALS